MLSINKSFLCRPVIPVARPVTGSQPPPSAMQANGLLGSRQISGDQRKGARAKTAPRRPVAIRLPKPKLTPEERLAQRREKDRRRRAAERAEREAAAQRNGTAAERNGTAAERNGKAAERVAARLAKEQERQEKRKRKEEERTRAREETRMRKEAERDAAQKRRDEVKERLRREREEARVRRVREKEAEREAKQRQKAAEDAAKRMGETGKNAAVQTGLAQRQVGRAKVQRPILGRLREEAAVGMATAKGVQKKGGKELRVGVRLGATKKGAAQANGKAQRGTIRGKKDTKKKAAVGRGSRKWGGRRAGERGEGAADEARGSRARVASTGGRVSRRLRALESPVKDGSGSLGADEANGSEGKKQKAGRKRAGGSEGSQGRPAKKGRMETSMEAEEGAEVVIVTRNGEESGTRTRKRQRKESDGEERGGTGQSAERGPEERRGKKRRVDGGAGINKAPVVQAEEKGNGRKGGGRLGGKKTPGRVTRSTPVEEVARNARSRQGGEKGGERERGEEKKRGRGRPKTGQGKQKEKGKESRSPVRRSSRRVSRGEGSIEEETGVDASEEKESKQRRRTTRRMSNAGSADKDEESGAKDSDRSEESETDGRARAPARSPEKRTRAKKTAADTEPSRDVTSPDGLLPAGRVTRGRKGAEETMVLRGSELRDREGGSEAGGNRGSERGHTLRNGNNRENEGQPEKRKSGPSGGVGKSRLAKLPKKDLRSGTREAEEELSKQAPQRQLRKAKLDQVVRERPSTGKTSSTDTEPRRSGRNSTRKK